MIRKYGKLNQKSMRTTTAKEINITKNQIVSKNSFIS